MARPPRVEVPGGFYHVNSIGSDSRRIFVDRLDFALHLELLTRSVRRHGWICHAYCLMPNHYHLLIQIPDGGLSRGMQELNGGFSRATNRRHGRRAHLFTNRFFGRLIGTDEHLLEAARYIVLNPVRAGLVPKPEDWPWSSYRSSVGIEPPIPALALDELLALFASSSFAAVRAYRDFVALGIKHRGTEV